MDKDALPRSTGRTVPLSSLQPGQTGEFFALLVDRTKRTTRDGKPFFQLRFRDRGREVTTPLWENSPLFDECDRQWQAGDHFRIEAVYSEHERFGPQIDIQGIRLVDREDSFDGFDPGLLLPTTRFNVDQLYSELLNLADSIEDEPLRALVRLILERNEAAVREAPAASRNHHAYRGGYLEHTVSVTRTGVYLANKYAAYYKGELNPPLNKDLIIAGCLLHDIGKIKEIKPVAEGSGYTVEGNLIGHILQGRDMIREAAKEIPNLNSELLMYLEHIILAHQGTPEWGSPKSPMMPEAFLVHHADDIDAKINMMVLILNSSTNDDAFTDQQNILRQKLLKRRSV